MSCFNTTPVGDEILRKKIDCEKNKYYLETVFIHPIDLIILLPDSRFQDASYYAKKGSLLDRGEVGLIVGVKIIVSTNVPVHKLLYSVNMGGYRSVQGPAWDREKSNEQLNPSRRNQEWI
jgi:hypothetical protein